MKIQIIAHDTEKRPKAFRMRWNRLPILFEKMGHKVDHILKQDWKKFYFRYLKFKPDVLISVGVIGALPAFLKKLHLIRIPIVHDWTDNYTEIMGKKYGITKIAFLEHFIVSNADFITTPSKAIEKKCELFERKAFYISHGVNKDFDKIKPARLKGKIKIVYTGNVTEYKQTYKLIDAANGLNCDVYLFGQANIQMKNIPKNVHFMGVVEYKEVPKYLKAADVLILTANDDSTLKMFEYIKAGKCILGIKGRLGYFLTHDVNAYLAYDLREGLKTLISNKNLRNKLAKNVKKIKVKTWEEVAKDYLNFLENTVLKHKKV